MSKAFAQISYQKRIYAVVVAGLFRTNLVLWSEAAVLFYLENVLDVTGDEANNYSPSLPGTLEDLLHQTNYIQASRLLYLLRHHSFRDSVTVHIHPITTRTPPHTPPRPV